jgi:hypothetical protein
MRTWVMGGCVLGVVAISALVFAPHGEPPAPPTPIPVAAPALGAGQPMPPEPAVLAEVVDVTDIDPLLDPPAIPVVEPSPAVPTLRAVGYEVPAPPPARPVAPVVPIPPAAEDEEPSAEQQGRGEATWEEGFRPEAGPALLDRESADEMRTWAMSWQHDWMFDTSFGMVRMMPDYVLIARETPRSRSAPTPGSTSRIGPASRPPYLRDLPRSEPGTGVPAGVVLAVVWSRSSAKAGWLSSD